MKVLKARVYEAALQKSLDESSSQRKLQVGSGSRSEKIRTYNYPQDRITDHRINLTLHNLPSILDGAIDELIDALVVNEQSKQLEASPL